MPLPRLGPPDEVRIMQRRSAKVYILQWIVEEIAASNTGGDGLALVSSFYESMS
jgi:hypothetical protein